jgi:hypothetical protein
MLLLDLDVAKFLRQQTPSDKRRQYQVIKDSPPLRVDGER